MGTLSMILRHPDEIYPLLKLKIAITKAKNQIPLDDPNLAFCYSLLQKVSKSFSLVIQQLSYELRNAVCVFYLILRALDTIEDDTSIPVEIKVPILIAFHRHIYDPEWHFSCGTKDYKFLMDQFHHVSLAFMELEKGYQEAIEEVTRKMGEGMAKFINKEVYYLEDINEIPKSRMFWPREIWGKYVDKLEDFKNEKKSTKAVQCLNEMITNALIHVEDCLKSLASLRNPAIFISCAIPQIVAIGTLALCYNNVQVFRGSLRLRRGLIAKVIDRTKTMDDVYGAFYDFSCMLKAKVDKNDPNATKTLNRIETIKKVCKENQVFHKRKSYINDETDTKTLIVMLMLSLAIIVFWSYKKQTNVSDS
ncbi:unnamed protein product [Cochlearia groenlandica]